MDKELNRLKEFCVEVLEYINRTEHEEIPFLKDMIKVVSSFKNKRDINSTVSEVIEMSQDYTGEKLELLNETLEAKNLPSLTFMRSKESRLVLSIVQRGAIKTDDEFRLLNSYLNETSTKKSSSVSIESVNSLLRAYETNQ
ncbi:hypothetical protein [Agarivorans sp. Alg241-V36]|uniref:hypothetical protein n=1 Tax=Agarivorans sp. Alg241-V36 TaxID=2305992 RepID=UPI0013D79310|nr:hypothetical protein [Agarivorans sp. Alg241-V36]